MSALSFLPHLPPHVLVDMVDAGAQQRAPVLPMYTYICSCGRSDGRPKLGMACSWDSNLLRS